MNAILLAVAERGQRMTEYAQLRAEHPEIPAVKLWNYVRSDHDQPLQEFLCPEHQWVYTGSAYDGDDERWHGEGRCYCLICGADGDS